MNIKGKGEWKQNSQGKRFKFHHAKRLFPTSQKAWVLSLSLQSSDNLIHVWVDHLWLLPEKWQAFHDSSDFHSFVLTASKSKPKYPPEWSREDGFTKSQRELTASEYESGHFIINTQRFFSLKEVTERKPNMWINVLTQPFRDTLSTILRKAFLLNAG